MTDAVISTLQTPDGSFTVLEDDQGRVLASGWTDSFDRVVARIPARHRPVTITEGTVTSADAVDAFYAGEIEHAMQVPVRQVAPSCSKRLAGPPADPRRDDPDLHRTRGGDGAPGRRPGSGQRLRTERPRPVRALSPRAAVRRLARRLRLGARRQALLLEHEAVDSGALV